MKFTLVAAWLMLGMGLAHAATKNLPTAKASRATAPAPVAPKDADGVAEARLIEIYTLIGKAQNRQALVKATSLVQDLPHFQLAQLVYGDLLTAQTRPIRTLGDMPDDLARRAPLRLHQRLTAETHATALPHRVWSTRHHREQKTNLSPKEVAQRTHGCPMR